MDRSVGGERLLEPAPILQALHRNSVRYVVVGGVAGNLHGSTTMTSDLDLVYSRAAEDIERLAKALLEIEARLGGAPRDLPFRPDAPTLKAGLNFAFITRYGPLDLLGEASGYTYDVLEPNAVAADLAGYQVRVAALDDLIRMKRAAGRLKDLVEVENLGKLRDVREGLGLYGLAGPNETRRVPKRAQAARRPRAQARRPIERR